MQIHSRKKNGEYHLEGLYLLDLAVYLGWKVVP